MITSGSAANAAVPQPDGSWELSHYRDVKAALNDLRLASSYQLLSEPDAKPGLLRRTKRRVGRLLQSSPAFSSEEINRLHGHWLIFADPPEHARLRDAVMLPFNERVKSMRPKIRALAKRLVAEGHATGTMELESRLAHPLPQGIITELLGMPSDASVQLSALPEHFGILMGANTPATPGTLKSSLSLLSYFKQVINDKRKHRADDLISDMLASQERGVLNEDEVVAAVILMWFSGYETLHRLVLGGTDALLRHPEQFRQLHSQPSLVPLAVEELLRFVSPAHQVFRYASTDFELGSVPLVKNHRYRLNLYAANHDSKQFHAPHELNLLRRPNQHLAFGDGPHICFGANLARLEAHAVFSELAQHATELQPIDNSQRLNPGADFGTSAKYWVRFA